jgi:hypothetical protein
LGEEVVENGSFQDHMVGEEVIKEVFGDPVKWKGMMKDLFSSHMGRRRDDENVYCCG